MSINPIVDEFNGEFKFMMKIYKAFKKGKFDEHETHVYHKRALLLMSHDPYYFINNTGPYFIKYRKPISNDNAAFFLTRDFKEDRKSMTKDTILNNEKVQEEAMNHLKNLWKTSNKEEKKIMTKRIKNMLSLYCKYLIEKKSYQEL